MYTNDYSGYFPVTAFSWSHPGHYYGYPDYAYPPAVSGFIYTTKAYLGNSEKSYLCPVDQNIWYAGSQFTEGSGSKKLVLSYQYNRVACGKVLSKIGDVLVFQGRKTAQTAAPSKAMLLADKDAFWSGPFGYTKHGRAQDGANGGNWLFVDGHTGFHSGYSNTIIALWYGSYWWNTSPNWE